MSKYRSYRTEGVLGATKYEVSHVVGKGAYGVVWAGRVRGRSSKKIAIKHIARVFQVKEDAIRIIRELRFLRVLKHPNIIAVMDVLLPRDQRHFDDVHIIFELFDTDLNHMIRSETKYDESHRRWIIFQVLQGLKHMHAAKVFHRDLKPGNILINANCDVKICDFGMARAQVAANKVDDSLVLWTDYVASRWYRAPELICCYQTPYTAAIDIWSLGCIFGELIRRKAVFQGRNGKHQLELITDLVGSPRKEEVALLQSAKSKEYLKVMRHKRPGDFPALFACSAQGVDLIRNLLLFNPNERITAANAIAHPYFDAIRALDGVKIPNIAVPVINPDDLNDCKPKDLSKDRLRAMMVAEIQLTHSDFETDRKAAPPEPA